MNLKTSLDEFRNEFLAQIPPEASALMHSETLKLEEEFKNRKLLTIGDIAPDFTLPNASDQQINLQNYLAKGPIILNFYRGGWCPYCNFDLQALEEVADEIRSRGASLLAISQQGALSSRKSKRDNNLSYPILIDQGGKLAQSYDLRWTLPSYLIEVFKMFKVDLLKIHHDDKWTLPMPARYIIDRDGIIAYAEVNPDYTQRPEPSDLFPILDQLAIQKRYASSR